MIYYCSCRSWSRVELILTSKAFNFSFLLLLLLTVLKKQKRKFCKLGILPGFKMLLFSISRAEKSFFENTAVCGCRDAEMIVFFLAFGGEESSRGEEEGDKLFISHLLSLL